jgi:hypothetical protein
VRRAAALTHAHTHAPLRASRQNPALPDGPRGFTPPRRFTPPDVGQGRIRSEDSESGAAVLLDLLCNNSDSYAERRYSRAMAPPACVDWAPPGVAPGRSGCALAVAFGDGRLVLFAPPRGRDAAWEAAEELTAEVQAHYERTGWQARPSRGAPHCANLCP